MGKTKLFAAELRRVRKARGYSSAHQFYKSVGGGRVLGLSFMSYWDVERGKKLPRSWRLRSVMAALGVADDSPQAREMVRAYFRDLSGSEELVSLLCPPAAAVGGGLTSRELAELAARRAVEQRSVNLSLDQWRLRSRDLETCVCQNYIVNTAGWVSVRELAQATGFAAGKIKKALALLRAARLVEADGERVRSPYSGNVIRPLPATPDGAAAKALFKRHMDKWLECARVVGAGRMTMRMTRANFELYRQHLENFVNLACVYSSSAEDRAESGIYCVDAALYSLFPRDGGRAGR